MYIFQNFVKVQRDNTPISNLDKLYSENWNVIKIFKCISAACSYSYCRDNIEETWSNMTSWHYLQLTIFFTTVQLIFILFCISERDHFDRIEQHVKNISLRSSLCVINK